MSQYKLSILIPTFNRKQYLIKNLENLNEYIKNLNLIEKVNIIISDNCSKDETYESVNKFKKNTIVNIKVYRQEKNIGLERNAIFCLQKALGEYAMFIGDDDYIEELYLKKVMSYISEETITCCIGNFVAIDNNFNILGKPRNKFSEDRIYECNFESLKELLINAHQMSGLTFKVKDTINNYKINNLYPFIYFIGFNMKRGKTVHITDLPIKVIQNNAKDWDYGNDGLIVDMFKNIYMLENNIFKRFILERQFIKTQPGRYITYINESIKFLKEIYKSSYVTLIFKFYITIIIIKYKIRMFFSKIKRRIINKKR